MIRFPRFHIATSVVNHILNVRDQISSEAADQPAPDVPDTAQASARLDAALSQPLSEMQAPEGADAALADSVASGVSPADALQQQGIIEGMT